MVWWQDINIQRQNDLREDSYKKIIGTIFINLHTLIIGIYLTYTLMVKADDN